MQIKASGRLALMIAATIGIGCIGPLHAQEATDAGAAATAQPAQQPNPLQQLFGIKPTPAPAAEQPAATEPGKPIALTRYRKARHSRRHSASRAHHRRAAKAAAERENKAREAAADSRVADADSTNTPPASGKAATAAAATALPAAIADARAQWPDANPATTGLPATMTAPSATQPTPADTSAAPTPATEAAAAPGQPKAEVVASDQLNEVDRAAAAAPTPTLALATVDPAASLTTGQAASASTDEASSWAQASFIGKIFIAFGGLLTLASAARMLFA